MSTSLKSYAAIGLYYLIARHLPPTNVPGGRLFSRIRAGLLRAFPMTIGRNADIGRGVYVGAGRDITFGHDSGAGDGCELHGPLLIGNHVMISPGVMIHTRNHRFSNPDVPIGQQGYSDYKPVKIGDDCWIGARAIILPGVSVGRGSIVGAGAVVDSDIPDFGIAVGNPASVVKYRRKVR